MHFAWLLLGLGLSSCSAESSLDVTDVRLADGAGPFGGRVEVRLGGIWGTICDFRFDIHDATVLCRMMNLSASTFVTGAHYGEGTGPIYAQELKCTGRETHLRECSFTTNVGCSHKRDIGIICTSCSEITVRNGKTVDISSTGSVLTTICGTGFTSNVTAAVCMNGIWSPPSIVCSNDEEKEIEIVEEITDIRLANGIGLYDGRVEVLVNGTWGTVCYSSHRYKTFQAICNTLFGTSSVRGHYNTQNRYHGEATGPILIDKLNCLGTETDMNDCSYSMDVSCSSHYHDAAVSCNVQPMNITNTRLVNGTGPYDGRIELYVDGHWGTICNRYITINEAKAICRTHNASLVMYFPTAVYGPGTGPVLVGYLGCIAEHLKYCQVRSPNARYCTHTRDLSIVCTPCGPPVIYNGDVFSFNYTTLTVKCHSGFAPDYIAMTCFGNGSWVEDQRCTWTAGYPLNISSIVLQSSSYPSEGRVTVIANDIQGTVCDTNFGKNEATVFCKMKGLEYVSYFIQPHNFGRGTGSILVDNLNCTGGENSINECSYNISNHCTHSDDVAIECTGYHLNITDIRLAGTKGPYHGRVELEVNGTWGTICDDHFSLADAYVICRMLGLRCYTYNGNAYYGSGTGPIYVDRLKCNSNEDHINECKYVVDNYYKCQHREDVSVMCYGPKLNITGARLVNGTGLYDGRAEIKVDDTWGTMCDQNFGILEADYFCQLLGLKAARLFSSAHYGPGNGPIFFDQVFCNDYDIDLGNCRYLFLNECTHDMDISVVCNECGRPDISHWDASYFTYNGTTLYANCEYYRTYVGYLRLSCDNETQKWVTEGECQEYSYPLNITDVRLSGGTNTSSGRVDIKSLDTWGTVCDDYFGMEEANLICKMVGYAPAVTYFGWAKFGEGNGPILVDDLNCPEDAEDLNECTYVTYDNCDHGDDVSVVCTDCGDPTPNFGSINSSATNVSTVVHIICDMNYELIGDADIVCQIDGKWSGSATCRLIDCGDPTPENGERNTTQTVNGTVVYIECDEGYERSGEAIITCQENGIWSDNTTCTIKDCGPLTPSNADVTLSNNRTTYGANAVLICEDGYEIPGSNTQIIKCLANGTWEEWFDCEPVDCGNPVPVGGTGNSSDTTFGSVVLITCDDGLNTTGDSLIVCQANGLWSDTPVCDSSDCGSLSIANGKGNTSQGTATGALGTVSCNQGYTLNGSSVVMCTAAGWNHSTIACLIQKCEDPTPENGQVTDTDASDGYVYGNYVVVECDTGYELQGESNIKCEDGGVWSNVPTCLIRDCGNLTSPTNGYVDLSQGTVYGAKIFFGCDDGFVLEGVNQTTCDENGYWTSEPPSCVRKSDIGGPCQDGSYCTYEGAVCVDSVCTCFTGVHDTKTKKCDIMPLFPYGESEGDTVLPKKQKCGPKVTFELGFPTHSCDNTHKEIYVCWSGYLSMDTVHENPSIPRTKKGSEKHTANVVAPFHAPTNIRKSMGVYYRSYDIRNSYSAMKENAALISYVEMVVQKFGNNSLYNASFVMITTWDRIKPTNGFDTSKTATFQSVLTSDGKTTYVFFIYGHGQMEWVNRRPSSPEVWAGFSVNGMTYTHPYSFTDAILNLDSGITAPKNKNDVAGLVFKALSVPSNKCTNPAVDCVSWYNANYEDKTRIDFIANQMPECPCDIWLSRFDPWFWRIGRLRFERDKEHACVDMNHVANYGHFGKTCCYDLRSWLWLYERPYAGGFQMYNSKHIEENALNDKKPKENCCALSDYCSLYYAVRPTGSCYKRSPYDFGVFWGDPHFRALDGLNFTFNGLGEYTLLQVTSNQTLFDLQARTERPLKANGDLSLATVFTAFAAKDSTNASVHIELNKEKTGISLYGNKMDLTKRYNTDKSSGEPFEWASEENNLIISERDDALFVLFPSFGISLSISVMEGMLSLNALVNNTLHGQTRGLLGNYNGDPYDDFIYPNGSMLSSNISEREVFKYGKTWEINPKNSAFVYPAGKSHSDFHNNSYVPKFLDEADLEAVKEAEKICNGSQNIQCVFDLVFIENQSVAVVTNRIKDEADSDKKELDETVPSITGCEVLRINKGQQASCSFNISDADTVYFVSNNVNATIDRNASLIYVTLDKEENIDIRIGAKNKNNRSSTALVIPTLYCTKCNGRGVCTDVPRDNGHVNEYFQIATCECAPEYEGLDCERDYDGCATNPCSLNRECIKLSAHDQKILGRAYNCSACPETGYETNVTDCLDIDECQIDTHTCEHNCTNTEGSFECSCKSGYRVNTKDPRKCRDINECEESTHNCKYLCENTDGSFECKCYSGYEFDPVSGECNKTNNGTCNDEENNKCQHPAGCMLNDEDTAVCFCPNGYSLDDNGTICEDIDECKSGICPHECNNTVGDFQCICYDGFRLENKITCKECDILHWGRNCTKDCVCTGQGANRCDNIRGCICDAGWQGVTCNEDIDECATSEQVCYDPRKECVNNVGSYKCECLPGFSEKEDGTCEDTDECADPLLNECSQLCKNTFGSYSCECRDGYTKDNTSCNDIDECKLGLAQCEQLCTNDPGGYTCSCYYGYTLDDDRYNCIKLSDPCLTYNNLTCEHFCLLKDGENATCSCSRGYIIGSDKQSCEDIDECKEELPKPCGSHATCKNTKGSYECSCPIGMKLENDGRTCTVCDEYHYGKNCAHECSCINGKCDKETGCSCSSGWFGEYCDVDIDECDNGGLECNATNTVCVNTLGSASCLCKEGYLNDSGVCKDIDECSDSSLNSCDQLCNNTDGGYYCSCRSGFNFNDTCIDVNECAGAHGCDHICENTIGSYRCSCEDGFGLDLTDRKSCKAKQECNSEDDGDTKCPTNSTCSLHNGTTVCICIKGYQKNENGSCEDINECIEDVNPCSDNCTNFEGGFTCSCDTGRHLLDDHVTCQECQQWKFGLDCAGNCNCSDANAISCNAVNGSCNCKSGWTGMRCDVDINECDEVNVCPDNSECSNSVGSYSCKCDRGYFKSGSGVCEVCDQRHYGENCIEKCECDVFNTDECNNVNGTCKCIQGWEGPYCRTDLNECTDNNICKEKPNSSCNNTEGSFRCDCKEGFIEDEGYCKDIDECRSETIYCKQKCVNTNGSYLCECSDGFTGTWNNCTDCSGNTYGHNCSKQCDCDRNNAQDQQPTCNTVNGTCVCKTNWQGARCTDDVDECKNDETICDHKNNSACENTEGWFNCVCIRGYSEIDGDICIKDTGEVTERPDKEGEILINLNVTLAIDIKGLNLDLPNQYETTSKKCVQSLKEFLSKFGLENVEVIVTNIRPGSIIVEYIIVTTDDKGTPASSQLTKALFELGQGTAKFNYDGMPVNASSDTFSNLTACDLYEQEFGECSNNCTVEEGDPVCKKRDDGSTETLFIMIGSAAAGLFLVIVIGIVCVCVHRKHTAKKKHSKMANSSHDDLRGQSLFEASTYDKILNTNQGDTDDGKRDNSSWTNQGYTFWPARTPTKDDSSELSGRIPRAKILPPHDDSFSSSNYNRGKRYLK